MTDKRAKANREKKKSRKMNVNRSAEQQKPENAAQNDSQDDYGGMDLANFRKNLGCGG